MSDVVGIFALNDSWFKHISVTLRGESVPMRWRLCHLVADFIARYYQALFTEKVWKKRVIEPAQSAGAIRFVVNELLENAAKYAHGGAITITIGREGEHLVCVVSNQVLRVAVPKLRDRFMLLSTHKTSELFNHQLAENLRETQENQSGLGYLLLQRDYQVSLGWRLKPVSPKLARIQTMAKLPIFEGEKMEIKGGNYRVWFDPSEVTVYFEGILRLGGAAEYAPIEELLDKVLATSPNVVTLDLRALNFLNSSGINVLYKFAISMRKKGDLQLVVRGSKNIPWQSKSLPNLKKFNQNFELILMD
jgi:hypothetical protein